MLRTAAGFDHRERQRQVGSAGIDRTAIARGRVAFEHHGRACAGGQHQEQSERCARETKWSYHYESSERAGFRYVTAEAAVWMIRMLLRFVSMSEVAALAWTNLGRVQDAGRLMARDQGLSTRALPPRSY